MRMRNDRGFTLIELLIVMALILIIGVFSSAFYTNFIGQLAVRDAREGLAGMFHEAQALSMSGRDGAVWGVKYQADSLTLFGGDSYANRNQVFDKKLEINSHIDISGFDEVVFDFPAGRPNADFPVINISWGNNEESLKLNSEGTVE